MSKKLENKKIQVNQNPYEGREGLVYARVSSKRQESEGSGLQSQDGRCKAELNLLGVPYKKTFPDSYTGGGDFMNRPAMRELLSYIDAHPHKKFVVIFDDLKRFARDVEFHLKLKTAFKVRNILLRCLNHNFDDSPVGKFVETVLAAGNELERHQNRIQVIQKQKARLEAGYWPFGAKKGYDMIKDHQHGKILVPNKEGLKILKPALEGFASGTFVRKIDACKFLVEKGFWKRKYPSLYIDKFASFLKDPAYMGDMEYIPWEVSRRKGHHKGIISEDTFNLIQKRLEKKGINKTIRTDSSETFPLRGLLICSSCGKSITGASSRSRGNLFPYYFCQNGLCELGKKSARKKDVEDGFNALLKKTKLKAEIGKIINVTFDRIWEEELKNIEKEDGIFEKSKDELEEKVRKLTDMMIDARSEKLQRLYEKQLEKVAEELESLSDYAPIRDIDLNIPYRTALNKAMGLVKSPYSIWQKVGVREKHGLFFFIFEEKLAYSKKEGYRTDNLPCAVRLFEDFVTSEPLDVDMRRNISKRLTDYLSRFWHYYQSSPVLQKELSSY